MLFSLILNGVVLGSILMLVSLGLTLIYGVGRVVNFAHGALYSAGAIIGVAVAVYSGSFWVALMVAPIAAGLLGLAIDYALLARIRNRPMVDGLLMTFGLALLITGVLYESGGRTIKSLAPPESLRGSVEIFGSVLPSYRIFLCALAVGLATALLIILRTTAWGVRVRAANDDAEMASILGIDREILMHGVVAIGSALAAFAGVAAAPVFTAYATVGDKMLILAFLTVVLGGLGSFRGAIAAAYAVGMVVVLGEGYIGGQAAMATLFGLVMVFLIRFPRGFFGEGRLE
jgi:branched-subunit amino acid ABC-type transport system permease component